MRILGRIDVEQATWLHTPPTDEKQPSLRRSGRLRKSARNNQAEEAPTSWPDELIPNFWESKDPFNAAADERKFQMLVERLEIQANNIARRSSTPKTEQGTLSDQEPVIVHNTSGDDTDNPQTPVQKSNREPLEPHRPRKRVRVEHDKTAPFISNRKVEVPVTVTNSVHRSFAEIVHIASQNQTVIADSPYANKKRKLNDAVPDHSPAPFATLEGSAEPTQDESSLSKKRKFSDTPDEVRKRQRLDKLRDHSTAQSTTQSEYLPGDSSLDLDSQSLARKRKRSEEDRWADDGGTKWLFGVRRWLGM